MIDRRSLLAGAGAAALTGKMATVAAAAEDVFPVAYPDEEWRKRLNLHQYMVLRRAATEPPYSSPLLYEERPGLFACVGCDHDLFDAETKYESGTGWPSFWTPLDAAIGTSLDKSLGYPRTAVHCATCGGHLGHVFKDGPQPTGLRYCLNGIALKFKLAKA